MSNEGENKQLQKENKKLKSMITALLFFSWVVLFIVGGFTMENGRINMGTNIMIVSFVIFGIWVYYSTKYHG